VEPVDHELELLLGLDGSEFRFASGYRIKIDAKRIESGEARPHGIKYSLTLHDAAGRRIYGLDNAHKAGRRREFDHRHIYGARRVVPYRFEGPAGLLEDFYKEVERILTSLGVMT
jgi:hypothetical protein